MTRKSPHGSVEVCLLCRCSLSGDKTCEFNCACHDEAQPKPDSEAKPEECVCHPLPLTKCGSVRQPICDRCGGTIYWMTPREREDVTNPVCDPANVPDYVEAMERVQPEPAKSERKIFMNNDVSHPGKCHGCLDGITLKFRDDLNEWWHYPEGLGAYRCIRVIGCPEHGTNCRVGIEIEKLQALGVRLRSVFHFADCPCFGDSVEHGEECGNCTCRATIEEEMRTELRAYGAHAQWLQAEAGRLWSYAAKQRRENYRLQEEIAHYKFALEGKQ